MTSVDLAPEALTRPEATLRHRELSAAVIGWAVAAVAVFVSAGAAWVLRHSPYPPNGVSGDQSFRIASILRDSQQLFPTDFAYRGLPAFYPPVYFAVLGRVVALTGVPAYEAMKLGVVGVALLVPLLGYGFWRRLTGDAAMAAAVVVASLAFHDWYEPYSWIALVVFVPWWFTFIVRVNGRVDGARTGWVVTGAVTGALIFMTYYYAFFIAAVHLACVLAMKALHRSGTPRLSVTRESWLVLAGTALFSAPFWAPLAVRVATGASFDSLQNRFFEEWMIRVPTPYLHFNIAGLVMFAGLASIVLGARRSAVLLGLGTFLVAAYLWFALGYLAVLADTPVVAFRTEAVIEAILVAAAGVGATDAIRELAARHDVRRLSPLIAAGVAAVVIAALVASSVAAIPYVADQRAARAPSTLLRAFDRATHGLGDDGVVMTSTPSLASYRLVHLFNVWNAHYANPLAEFRSRSRFLARLARQADPAVVATALRHNRYDAVGIVVLHLEGSSLTYMDTQDNFPRGARFRTLRFGAGQFGPEWFTRTDVGDVAVMVAVADDPIDALSAEQLRVLRTSFRGDLT